MEQIGRLIQNNTYIAVDTSICIYFFEGQYKHYTLIRKLFEAVEEGNITFVFSALLLTELYTGPLRSGDRATVEVWKKYFSHYPHMRAQEVNEAIAMRAAELRGKYNLQTPDALHIASALESQVEFFLTNDKALKKITELTVLTLEDLLV